MNPFRRGALLLGAALSLFVVLTWSGIAEAFPNPVLKYVGQQNYMAGGQPFTRFNLAVLNRAAYPNFLFAPAPNLPPCGLNKKASRTWVDIFNRQGPSRLYGFCALSSNADLAKLWFAVPQGSPHARFVFIVMTDRATNTKYKSNTVVIP